MGEMIPPSPVCYPSILGPRPSTPLLYKPRIMVQDLGPPDLDQLRLQLQQLSVPCVSPDSPGFDKLARSYNRVFSYRPAAICVPREETDVSNAILCARAHGVKVQEEEQCRTGQSRTSGWLATSPMVATATSPGHGACLWTRLSV